MKSMIGVSLVVLVLGTVGCASPQYSASTYGGSKAQTAQYVKFGTVESVKVVTIGGESSGIGAVTGAVVGGVGGSHIGGGSGRIVGAVAGAVLGGVVGNSAEKKIKTEQGLEITTRLDSGEYLVVVQSVDEQFRPGDRVRVITSGSSVRVTR